MLVLGWIGCALVCGAITWRPHMWITGTKGSGKSTLDNLISQIMGNLALHIQGNTTEPGLRQALGGDARPILFDEFEADSRSADAVIDAARTAASDNSALIAKGSPEGRPNLYRLRFAAMFSGIIANARREADRSRIVFLEMHPRERTEQQRKQIGEALDRFGGDFGASLLSRMLEALNGGAFDRALSTLRNAIRISGGDERKADVFAHLLAANHVLVCNRDITIVEAQEQAELIVALDEGEPSDEEECLSHLMGHRITVDYGYVRTVGEWIGYLQELTPTGPVADVVLAELERHGVKVEGNSMKIANSTTGIRGAYKATRWSGGSHWRIIRRLPEADAGGNAWFAGEQSKCTVIPLKIVTPGVANDI
jgi:putative DNA primase/helicase